MRWMLLGLAMLIAGQGKEVDPQAKAKKNPPTKKANATPESADMQKLIGEWVISKAQYLGKELPQDSGGPTTFFVKDGKITFLAKGKPLPTMSALQIKLDESKSPKHMDLFSKEKGQMPCCYQFSDDKLIIAMPMSMPNRNPPMQRPTSVTGEGQFITFEAKKKPQNEKAEK